MVSPSGNGEASAGQFVLSSPGKEKARMRVMYIDGVGPFGGASRSLYEAVNSLPKGKIHPLFVATKGSSLKYYREVAADIIETRGLTRFDNTRYSHYRGRRWLILLRELFHFPWTIAALLRAKKKWKAVDIVHANEITEIIPLLIAKWLFRAPAVVHVRSVQNADNKSLRYRCVVSLLKQHVSAVIAIDENVRASLPADMEVTVIHNSITPSNLKSPDVVMVSKLDKLRKSSLKVGFIGNLHHSKGLFDLLDAAKQVIDSKRDVEFVIIGGETSSVGGLVAAMLARIGFAQNIRDALLERVNSYGLQHHFHLLGPTADIQSVYERMDVLCFPSHADAPGRPVIEAAFAGKPSIVAVEQPRGDTLVDHETGLAVPGKDPARLASAICYFVDNPGELHRMGKNALTLAKRNFDPQLTSAQLSNVYDSLI